jgi:hypothetical protein
MLDVNQSLEDCYQNNNLQPHSIEWLCQKRGFTDPFIHLTGQRPNSTTQTPNWDIDFIYTYGINACNISTQELNYPINSDHSAIAMYHPKSRSKN